MKKGLAITIIICAILFVIGGVLIAIGVVNGGAMMFNIDYKNHKITSSKNAELISGNEDVDAFTEFDIDVDAAKVTIVKGDSYNVTYKLYEQSKVDISVESGKLIIKRKAEKNNFNFGFFMDNVEPYIQITIPEDAEIKDGKINSDAGSVILSDLEMNNLSLNVDAGEINLSDSTLNELTIEDNAGSVTFDNLTAKKANINTDYGDINVNDSEIEDLSADLDAGDLDIDMSKVNNLEINVDYGDVDVKLIGEKADYEFNVKVDAGDIHVDGANVGNKYISNEGKDKKIKIDADAGDVDIEF